MIPTSPDKKPVDLYNPTSTDFKFGFADANNKPHEYILPAGEIVTLPKYIADKGALGLADRIVWARGLAMGYEHELKKAMEEIYV